MELEQGPEGWVEFGSWAVGNADEQDIWQEGTSTLGVFRRLSGSEGFALGYSGE